MHPHTPRRIVCFFCCLLNLAYADEIKRGSAFPTNSKGKLDLPLATFINQRSHVTDWSLVVLLRGEKHYILSDTANRDLLTEPPAQGDVVALDEVATSFVGWRRLNPGAESSVFWKANPKLLEQTIRCSSPATDGAYATPSEAESKLPQSQPIRPLTNRVQSAHPSPPQNAPSIAPAPLTPSEDRTLSTAWSVAVVLIVSALGLLWLLLNNHK